MPPIQDSPTTSSFMSHGSFAATPRPHRRHQRRSRRPPTGQRHCLAARAGPRWGRHGRLRSVVPQSDQGPRPHPEPCTRRLPAPRCRRSATSALGPKCRCRSTGKRGERPPLRFPHGAWVSRAGSAENLLDPGHGGIVEVSRVPTPTEHRFMLPTSMTGCGAFEPRKVGDPTDSWKTCISRRLGRGRV